MADAANLHANQRQLDSLGSDAKAWARAIESLDPKQASTAAGQREPDQRSSAEALGRWKSGVFGVSLCC